MTSTQRRLAVTVTDIHPTNADMADSVLCCVRFSVMWRPAERSAIMRDAMSWWAPSHGTAVQRR